MNYKLIKKMNRNYSCLEQILNNRGIEDEDMFHYMNTTDEDINHPNDFGPSMEEGVLLLLTTINQDLPTTVIVDCDCDGFTSSALLINFLHELFPYWVENKLTYFIHSSKQHGLSDFDIESTESKLIILPDAGSNDYKYHRLLAEKGVSVLVLDHHDAEKISEDAIVINNQLSDYPNKDMSGVGVTWQFCRYIDAELADNFLDLVALGMNADMMSLLSVETKHLINKGWKNLRNPFFISLSDKHAFSMKNKVDTMGVAFYIAPYVNATVRSGTLEEKHIIFRSMLSFEAFKKIPSTKRGHKAGEEETVLVQAIRNITNIKNRQTKAQETGMLALEGYIQENNLLEDKVLVIKQDGLVEKSIAGLVSMKFAAKYQRPVMILSKVETVYYDETIDGVKEIKKVCWAGSARGFERNGILDFKSDCKDTGVIEYAEGHPNAFGVSIPEDKINDFRTALNEKYKYIDSEPTYLVDFIFSKDNFSSENILEIERCNSLWGKDFPEPLIAIENLKVYANMVTIMARDKKKQTIKITLPNNVSLIKFGVEEDEYNKFLGQGYLTINVIGKANLNEYQGRQYAQIMIEDYEITENVSFCF